MDAQSKLYVIVRADMPPGCQASQLAHAAQEFCFAHPALAQTWREVSNRIALLAAPDVAALEALALRAGDHGVALAMFRDPDEAPELTALALAPGDVARKLCRKLPLALAA